MNIALTFNVKRNKPSTNLEEQIDSEFDSPEVTKAQKETLESLGHKVFLVEADIDAFENLKKLQGKIDLVFNVAEGMWGDARESQIPLFCEMLKIPYTHSNPTTHAISLNKHFTKLILSQIEGINLPKSFVVDGFGYKIPKDVKYPVIIKPNEEGSGKGILEENIVDTEEKLKERIKIVSKGVKTTLIVEEFVDGREFTVGILGNGDNVQVLPIIEQMFGLLPEGKHKIAGYELKWIYEYNMKAVSDVYECPAKLDEKTKNEIERITKEICKVLEVKDTARLDFRLDKEGNVYFLEINTIPGIHPDPNETSCFPLAARTAGIEYKEMIEKIVSLALERYKNN